MAKYAAKSSVPVGRTKAEIEALIRKYGAGQIFTGWDEQKETAVVGFNMARPELPPLCIRIHARIALRNAQAERTSWRALLLCIKAKLESVANGIETVEQAFFANIILPDNRTVYDHAAPHVLKSYASGSVINLLPGV